MKSKETIDGYTFEYNEEHKFYECRGEVCYDDEHDEMPEEGGGLLNRGFPLIP